MPAEIIDARIRSNGGFIFTDIINEINSGLALPHGKRVLPTLLLYDEKGLRLYDDITTKAPEYYLFGAEEEILKNKVDEVVQSMHSGRGVTPGEVVVELGAGALRKTSHILLSLSRLVGNKSSSPPITYYALDVEERELERTLSGISKADIGSELIGKVATKGMWGTYDDGLKFIQNGGLENSKLSQDLKVVASPIFTYSSPNSCSESSPPLTPVEGIRPPSHIMFLGSTLGNFTRSGAVSFLRSLPLRPGCGDTLLLGLDHDNDKDLIELAYNDPRGYTKRFIFNAFKVAGRTLGDEDMFNEETWDYVNYYNVAERQHEAFFKSKCNQEVYDPKNDRRITFLKDEMMKIEHSLKFSDKDAYTMFAEADLRPIQRWTDSKGQYSLWLLERSPFTFPSLSRSMSVTKQLVKQHAKSPYSVPSREDWRKLWTTWDFISLKMIPPSMLYQKPIDLRHICLFYLGHVPAFLDTHLSGLLQEPHTEPEHFKHLFERGIDPNVDDPGEINHSHSEVPTKAEDWPSLTNILTFKKAVRARLFKVYDDIDSGTLVVTRKVARVLFMTFEHEATHAETLLYMLLQRAGTGTIPPPNFTPPLWECLKASWDSAPAPHSSVVSLGPATVTLGHDDDDSLDENEGNIENHEFGWDNEHPRRSVEVGKFTISWRPVTNGELYQFYIDGGKDKVEFPTSWAKEGDKIMVRTLYGPVSMDIAQRWPVIAPYDTLSTYASVKGGRLPTEAELRLFFDKFDSGYEGGTNVGFRNWHPVPATTGTEKYGAKGTNGGVWEWTSTAFNKVDGFAPSRLYPGYSQDFFDGKHNVVLGGSYATIPRIAERRSFRNWYQHNYPYAWIGGRIVYDVPKDE